MLATGELLAKVIAIENMFMLPLQIFLLEPCIYVIYDGKDFT